MPNIRSIPLTITEIASFSFSLVVLKGPSNCSSTSHWSQGRSIRRWTGEQLTRLHMEALQAAYEGDLHGRYQVPEERQYALILVAGGDEAYNRWDTLEDMVEDPKKVDQVWDSFKKSFEQSTSFWHFRDAYLADFRFYMINTDMPRILISHAASYWLGLVKVLCDNKAPRVKRQVASIDKKSDFRVKSGPFRTSTSNMGSSSQKKQTTSKMVTSEKVHFSSPRMHSFEDTKLQGRKRHIRSRSGRDVDISDGEQYSPEEPSVTIEKELKTSKTGNSVLSGPNKKIRDNLKDSPFRKHTAGSSNAKLGPKRKHTSKEAPCRKYYMPSNDTKTFQINNKGHLQCHQDPNLIHKPNNKGKLLGSREAPIYHEPGTVSCKTTEDLKKLYPNSFDRLGSLKGAYNIRVDPTVKPATHARRKVPIESKEAIDKELDYLIEEEIITEQVEPTPWVSSVTFPMKPNREVRVCLDPSNLNKAIIREHHKPMMAEEIAHELARATVYTKADVLKAFLQIHLTHEASLLTMFNSHRGQL